jgi:hypothetical protein
MNRSIVTVLLILLVCVVAFGFYRGWFALSRRGPDATTNQVNVNLTVDRDKMHSDADLVQKKATELTGKPASGASELAVPANDNR